jgi:hypothetical protein
MCDVGMMHVIDVSQDIFSSSTIRSTVPVRDPSGEIVGHPCADQGHHLDNSLLTTFDDLLKG